MKTGAATLLLSFWALACAAVDPAPVSPAPDYAEAATWAARDSGSAKPADVFYIHPTTFRSHEWNQQMADDTARAWTDLSVRDRQLDAFASCCARFMPYYRQASSRAFAERNGDGAKAYAFAYADVRRAFRHYLEHDNHGRPFILAGHSQGALHGLQLLREEIAGTSAESLLVAAYLPGLGIPAGSLPPGIKVCVRPDSTGCVASWNSFAEGTDAAAYIARSVQDYGTPGRDERVICTNPLTFDVSRPDAEMQASQGARPGSPQPGPVPALEPGKVAAECQGGVLMVNADPSLKIDRLPGGVLHMADIAMFWRDISNNASLRVAAWMRTRK
ncbi:DUF3089 domain-containing protein [Blastomonas sp.]|uniref:DUF3089 domain-containing protein n=1 Tax=Blastomonas sp. TaxID=1909299 RepID=UPI00391B3A5F